MGPSPDRKRVAAGAPIAETRPPGRTPARQPRGETMPTYLQADRPLRVTTPLGADVLLLAGSRRARRSPSSSTSASTSRPRTTPPSTFDRLLGQPITVDLGAAARRRPAISGGSAAGSRRRGGTTTFTYYRMEVVPQLWLLTRKAQSRIFQQISVPDILKQVLDGPRRRLRAPGDLPARATTASSTARPTSTSPAA